MGELAIGKSKKKHQPNMVPIFITIEGQPVL